MRHTYHIITPFMRFEYLVKYSRFMKSLGVHWHPLLDDSLPFRISESDWIHPHVSTGKESGWKYVGHYKCNRFLDSTTLSDDDRYLFLNDDDWLEPEFLEKVDKEDGDLLIVSMKRGHHQPPTGPQYGTFTLEAKKQNIAPSLIGGEQMVVKGRLLKTERFGPGPCDDGELICRLCRAHPYKLVPGAFVWFNYLEPGRWKKEDDD